MVFVEGWVGGCWKGEKYGYSYIGERREKEPKNANIKKPKNARKRHIQKYTRKKP